MDIDAVMRKVKVKNLEV